MLQDIPVRIITLIYTAQNGNVANVYAGATPRWAALKHKKSWTGVEQEDTQVHDQQRRSYGIVRKGSTYHFFTVKLNGAVVAADASLSGM